MAIKASTGLRNGLMVTGPLNDLLADGKLRIFSGPAPASADDAETGTLLCEITVDSTGTGISMATTAVSGSVTKAAEIWSGVNVATGTASYYRHVAAGDDGTLSTTQPRLQGSVGLSGADLNLSNVNLVASAPQTIDAYSVTLPTL